MSHNQLVLVTGASGYIATHVVQQLLHTGYKVRGTVRSLENEEKVKPLRELCQNAKYPLELVEADLMDADCWKDAVKDCKYVLHVASPVSAKQPKDDEEVIRPAVEGTLAILEACAKSETVERVVITSSCAAINGSGGTGYFCEKNWPDTLQPMPAYVKSKILAEKAAWDFVKGLPGNPKFELVTVNPGFVLGPVLCGTLASSMEVMEKILERKMPALPRIGVTIIDVREVAAAHIKAMTTSEAANNRHILAGEFMWLKDMAVILDKEFRSLGYNVPTWEAPYILAKLASFFDKTLQSILPIWDTMNTYDTSRMNQVLGITVRPAEETIIEMAHSMIEKGFIKKTNKYKDIHERQREQD